MNLHHSLEDIKGSFVMPLVTIVMPAYNGCAYISDSIQSVLNQTFIDWELIVVDDCSLDSTPLIVDAIAAGDSRVKLIRNITNCGPLLSRNVGMGKAFGRFISFLDQDDIWLSDKLDLQVQFMINNGLGITFTAWRRMSADGMRQGRVIDAPEVYGFHEFHRDTGVALSSCIIDTLLVGHPKFADTHPYTEYEFYREIFMRGIQARGLHIDLLRYRVSSSAMSYNKFAMARLVWCNFRVKAKLPIIYAIYCFSHYAIRATLRNFDSLDEEINFSY